MAGSSYLVICGPTASGKSSLALELAEALDGSVVCCDSVQLYKGFDIGSAKPTIQERQRVPHYLFDHFEWHEPCDAAIYRKLAHSSMNEIRTLDRLPIVVGGTGLYLRALMGQEWSEDIPGDENLKQQLSELSSEELYNKLLALDPDRAKQLHQNDRFRVIRALEINLVSGKNVGFFSTNQASDPRAVIVYLCPDRMILKERISLRAHQMLKEGLVQEVRGLLKAGVTSDSKPMQSIGYQEVNQFLKGEFSESELLGRITTSTRQYAKRQVTWFNKVPVQFRLTDIPNLGDLRSSLKGLLQ